ncbi:NADH-ubiquinone oxidoreductase 17.8 kDa subunit [Metarhizium album ARSEF 1941]|uniref:NADH-ubiquinone oxidoreductase 17.8 kDa subunit n=1 Tax=Metarhizium album (strain ARSEF 1941) TaxID=1081103 RepID=A0A0B2X4A0_METAS|nr:NADH-ubiquinone oxidoreductase 17.8 kDa subunit [Metarhizium album ARSEF 1941]KHO00136.1 NADH-ubiquinone oxidoreductase 17.8 kDa subunit [Metarhizium album ARSEF 1941]
MDDVDKCKPDPLIGQGPLTSAQGDQQRRRQTNLTFAHGDSPIWLALPTNSNNRRRQACQNMSAARKRVGQIVRQLPRTARTYASDAHGQHKAAQVNESFGKGSIATVAAFFGGVLFYQFVPEHGEDSSVSNVIHKYLSRKEDWEQTNALHAKAMEQAGFDRNLFENASNKHRFVDVAYPEAIQSHAPRNIQAGHLMNLDHVVDHYRRRHLEDEERKAKKLAENKA